MPTGTHRYYEQIDPRAGAIRPEDPEFEAQVRARIGPDYEGVVNRGHAARIDSSGPVTYRGVNLSGPVERSSFLENFGHFFDSADRDQLANPEKQVFGFDNAANPQTYAHEFRHSAGVNDELANRVQDLIFSTSEPQYVANVRMMFEGLYRRGLAPSPDEVSFADKEDTVLNYLGNRAGLEDQIDQGARSPLEQLKQYPFLHFVGKTTDPRNPGGALERRGVPGYARGGRSRRTWRDYARSLGGGAQGAGYLYDAATTTPVLSALGSVGDATTAAGSAIPSAADIGLSAAGPSALGAGLGVLGVFNTAVDILGGGTFQSWIHDPNHTPTQEQWKAVEQVLLSLGDRYTPGLLDEHTFRLPAIDGRPLGNEAIWRLATGRPVFRDSDNPVRIDWDSGDVLSGSAAMATPGAGPPPYVPPATSTPPISGTPPQGGTDIDGNPVVFNEEGVLGTPGIWDILNSGGSGVPDEDMGDYDNYPTTGGVTGGTPTPSGSGSWDEILAGVGGAGAFGGIWDWVKKKWPDLASGGGGNSGSLGEFGKWFGELPWYIKAGLGAGALGLVADSVTPTEYNPNAPPKFPGQPETLTRGAPRTALAPNIDYYTYGQRPGVAFFSDVNVPAQPERVNPMPATENGNNPAKPNWLPGVPTYKAEGGALSPVQGSDSGRADTIDARLSPGEYIFDAESVALLGDGNNEAGARKLDAMRRNLRKHKGKALARGKFSANAREPEQYLRVRK